MPNHQLPSRYQITKALDVWALGITLYTLLYGNIPYDVRTEFELYDTIPNHQFIFPDEMTADRIAFALQPRDSFASHAINLLESTLQKDPSKRITIEGVKVSNMPTAPSLSMFAVRAVLVPNNATCFVPSMI